MMNVLLDLYGSLLIVLIVALVGVAIPMVFLWAPLPQTRWWSLFSLWICFYNAVITCPLDFFVGLIAIAHPHIFDMTHSRILLLFVSSAISSILSFGFLCRKYGIKDSATGAQSDLPLDNFYFSIIT
jgi:hypothetical protein